MKNSFLRILVLIYAGFLALLLALVGIGFLITGLFLYLSTMMDTWAAGFATGAALLLVLLIFALAAWLTCTTGSGSTTSGAERQEKGDSSELLRVLKSLLEEGDISTRELSLYALIAGGVLGASPELRRLVISLLSPPERKSGDENR